MTYPPLSQLTFNPRAYGRASSETDTMMKKDSEAWKLAQRICRRQGTNLRPIALSNNGQVVTFQSLIRGNTLTRTLSELRLIA
jgi:hypothetical protein